MSTQIRPGIKAIEFYFPRLFVSQDELEDYDKVEKGKYTIGLGQQEMSFCSDREDVYSLALTVVSNLMENNNISYKDIGRLSVSSETILDHSKSIKSVLMQLFKDSGNNDVEGVDLLHACYSGTAALFDAVAWMESQDWDERYALVVCVDIAEYAAGRARPSGGAGAVAMLLSKDGCIKLEPVRASYMDHAYDFYKPNLDSPYPVVDGELSNSCFLNSLDSCYRLYSQKIYKKNHKHFRISDVDYWVFHAPYQGLVRKSYSRLVYNDFFMFPDDEKYASVQEYRKIPRNEAIISRELYKAFVSYSEKDFERCVKPGSLAPKRIGNMYTASIFSGLVSLIYEKGENLVGKRIGAFSYGSGICSSLYVLSIGADQEAIKQLRLIQKHANLNDRLEQRIKLSPENFTLMLQRREKLHKTQIDNPHGTESEFRPRGTLSDLFEKSYYVSHIDVMKRRTYVLHSKNHYEKEQNKEENI